MAQALGVHQHFAFRKFEQNLLKMHCFLEKLPIIAAMLSSYRTIIMFIFYDLNELYLLQSI